MQRDFERSTPWLFRDPSLPNPLQLRVTRWSEGVTKYGPTEWLMGSTEMVRSGTCSSAPSF